LRYFYLCFLLSLNKKNAAWFNKLLMFSQAAGYLGLSGSITERLLKDVKIYGDTGLTPLFFFYFIKKT